MKVIKYQFMTEVNSGTEEHPDIVQTFADVTMGWNEANEEIAKREAYNGEYEIIDDGEPEPEPSTESILLELAADHEARLCEIELGV